MKISVYLSVFCLLLSPMVSNAQHLQPKLPADQIIKSLAPTRGPSLAPAGFINPMVETGQPDWDIELIQRGGIFNKTDQQDELKVLKEIITANKIANELEEGRLPPDPVTTTRHLTAVTPIILSSFQANNSGNSGPPDNTMAISDDGYIVSMINSSISYMDENGNVLLSDRSFTNLLSSLNVSNLLFDPKVIYDPEEDKFILVLLSGNTPSTSKVVVGFSKSQNPADGWWFYTFDGEFLDGNWFDFPNIGISEHDLFITGNLFANNPQSVVLQIKKSDGFVGEDLDWEYFGDVQTASNGDAFTIVPASYGYDGAYGPGIFMVSNVWFGGAQIFLYEVTDSVNSEQMLNVYSVSTVNYSLPGNALQLGSNDRMDTGDCRITNAFFANRTIHYVFDSDITGGYSGVRYNRLNVSTMTNQHTNFGLNQTDCCYPSVVPFGVDDMSTDVMITYLSSSSSIFPRLSVVNVDNEMSFSDPVIVKAGESPITSFFDTDRNAYRWGDYSGGSRRHSSTYPNAWFVGCYAKGNGYGNWIFEVSNQAIGLAPLAEFEGAPRTGEAPHTAFFNDLSINGAENFTWNFEGGDPATSNERNLTVNYETPGKYDVELIVSNAFGSDTIVKEEYIRASILPTADFTSDVTEGAAPLTVNFENLALNNTATNWQLQGGSPSSTTDVNPTVVYNNPGTYNVTMFVVNEFGSDSESKPGYITVGAVGVNEEKNVVSDIKVYPNPIAEVFTLEFFLQKKTLMDISIVDVSGHKVKTLLYGRVKGGQNLLSFNKNALSPGTYFLIVRDDQQNVIKNEKIIIGQ